MPRGTKYPENICNSSKSSISLMMCGSAAGEIIPPYIVYKSQHMWSTWTENSPKRCRYHHTKSGWFDSVTFEDWFFSLLLPRLRKLQGKKVVIGDNLSSHLSVAVFQRCREEDIYFVCLPPNSTHLTQPLDVAFFHPMKVGWRKILSNWKETPEGLRNTVIPKATFPALLKELMEVLHPNVAENLKSGFRKCGIYPCDAFHLLKRPKMLWTHHF